MQAEAGGDEFNDTLNCRLIDNQLNLIYLAYHPQIN
jgi:hypothetical protein